MSAPFKTERFKLLRVVGETEGQLVKTSTVTLDKPAVKVDRVDVRLTDVDHKVFDGKVVKQGVLVKQIFYVDNTNTLRHQEECIPFDVVLEIPGVDPDMDLEIQNKVLSTEVDFQLVAPTRLEQKVVIHLQVKVSEYVQRNLVVALGNVVSTDVVT